MQAPGGQTRANNYNLKIMQAFFFGNGDTGPETWDVAACFVVSKMDEFRKEFILIGRKTENYPSGRT